MISVGLPTIVRHQIVGRMFLMMLLSVQGAPMKLIGAI